MHKCREEYNWEDNTGQQMKDIVIDSLKCAQGEIKSRKSSWELYGFDFMFDDNIHPWLIEINSSPACDYSTNVTEEFVKQALPGIVRVVLGDVKNTDQKEKGKTNIIRDRCKIYQGD